MGFIVFTEIYKEELLDCIEKNSIHVEIKLNQQNLLAVNIMTAKNLAKNLSDLLENIVLDENSIVRSAGSAKLKNILRTIVFSPQRKDIINSLKNYILENDEINIDGYVKFRMNQYARQVNLTLYRAAKKSLIF